MTTRRAWPTSQGRAGSGGFPPKVRMAILTRDGHQCTYVDYTTGLRCPRTTATHKLEADHIIGQTEAHRLGWSIDEMHDMSNGRTLCEEHHLLRTKAQARAGMARKARRRPQRDRHPGLR